VGWNRRIADRSGRMRPRAARRKPTAPLRSYLADCGDGTIYPFVPPRSLILQVVASWQVRCIRMCDENEALRAAAPVRRNALCSDLGWDRNRRASSSARCPCPARNSGTGLCLGRRVLVSGGSSLALA